MLDKTIPVDEMFGEMMNWAVRYALGRRTYAVADTCGYIKPLVAYLDDQTLTVMHSDISYQQRIDLGDSFDAEKWLDLKQTISDELERRKSND